MAILGIQFVITFTVALIMQKLSPVYSLARWIMCNGLYRYLYPTNDTLKALAGRTVTKPAKGRKSTEHLTAKKSNGRAGVKHNVESFSIPCNLNIVLEKTKVEEIDLLSQHKYQDYRWLIDVGLCAFVVYLCVEIAVLWKKEIRTQEFNLSLVWCLIVVYFALRELASLTASYWHADDSGEKSMCISFGLFFMIMSMGILVVDESILEFGLENGYTMFMENLISCMKQLGFTTRDPPPVWAFKLTLVALSGVIGAFLGFPGLRLANIYLDSLYYNEANPLMQILLHASFLSPLIPIVAWIKPMSRDVLVPDKAIPNNQFQITQENFAFIRICTVIAVCVLRLIPTRTAMQAYLNMANDRVVKLRKETGQITNIQIQGKVARIFFYMSAVAMQYLAPILLLLFLSLSWVQIDAAGSVPTLPLMQNINSTVFSESSKYVLILRKAFYNVELFKGLISYSIWWTLVCWFSTSAFGVFYLKTFGS